jgi:Sulfotransferase domain
MAAVRPNFFIVGAPKCGTTALYEYLRPHPNIFLSRHKEPHFFATDLGTYPFIKTPEAYAALFADATERHLRVGEASVYYLRSATAIGNIREYDPGAKLIAMFRNPVDMVHSFHSQLLYVTQENVRDFEAAWRLQARRSQGLDLPPRSRGAFLLQYADMACFGSQAQRLLSIFPADQVKIILYDDFARSPQRVYDEVMAFLEIPHDGRTEFPRINENKRATVTWLRRLMVNPPRPLREAYHRFKRAVGGKHLDPTKQWIIDRITVRERRSALSTEFRAELVEAFREEVALLSRLLNRDLSHWK